MKKVALIFAALLLLVPLALSAQVVVKDDFLTLGDWKPGYGEWGIRGGMLVQKNTTTGLARIDRMVPQSGEVEIAFNIRYEAGGFKDEMALAAGQFHAGFGLQVGVENPALGRIAWGAGNSYLLWLNLDTTADTMKMAMDKHFGFRGQVYLSKSNSVMDVTDLNVDIVAELAAAGIDLSIDDLGTFLDTPWPIKIRVNYATGRIMVMDPTSPTLWLYFDVDPKVLAGNYVSLRTNSLAVSFSDFVVTKL